MTSFFIGLERRNLLVPLLNGHSGTHRVSRGPTPAVLFACQSYLVITSINKTSMAAVINKLPGDVQVN